MRASQPEISRIVLGSKFSGQTALGRVFEERHDSTRAAEAGGSPLP
jgi:hypothetical protein